jgi:ACS family sodium-dependent inorganic phosphate cotransporter
MTRYSRRVLLAIALCFSNIICYADRANIGIAILHFDLDSNSAGLVLSAFLWGYVVTQFLGGWAANRYGGKTVLLVGICVWSVCDLLTVAAFRSGNLNLIVLARIGMGLGEGVQMPALHHIGAAWFPLPERSRLMAVVTSGQDLGIIVSMLVSPAILQLWGWEYIFFFFSAASAVWVVFFYCYCWSTPEAHPNISAAELAFITSTRPTPAPAVPWKPLVRSKAVLAIALAHVSNNWGWYILVLWLPKYISDRLGVDLSAQSEVYAALPFFCGFLGLSFGGWISDTLIARRLRIVNVRKIMNSIGLFGPSLCMLLLMHATSLWQATLLLSLSLGSARFVCSGFWTNMIDVGGPFAGQVMSFSNTIATLPSMIGVELTGLLLGPSENWSAVFGVAAVVYLGGGIVFLLCASDVPVIPSRDSSTPGQIRGRQGQDGFSRLNESDIDPFEVGEELPDRKTSPRDMDSPVVELRSLR